MSIQRLANWGGDYDYQSTEDEITDGNFYGFTVLEDDTEIDVMSGGPSGNVPSPAIDYKGSDQCNLEGKILPKGAFYTVPEGDIIKNWSLTSGHVTLHRSSKI